MNRAYITNYRFSIPYHIWHQPWSTVFFALNIKCAELVRDRVRLNIEDSVIGQFT